MSWTKEIIEKNFKAALMDIIKYPNSYADDREIVVTAYGGCYGQTAGYIIAINGSPPKGEIWIPWSSENPNEMIVLSPAGELKRLKTPHNLIGSSKTKDYKKRLWFWTLRVLELNGKKHRAIKEDE